MARFVLVHGAFGGAWSWEAVTGPLEALGHTVEAVDLPGAGDDRTPVEHVTLASYAERVGAALGRSPEPAVLVGTSMGGMVVTQAAGNDPERVASLVFVCGFMPGDGQSMLDLAHLPEAEGDLIQANLVVEGDPPVGTLAPEAAIAAMYNCCTDEQAARAAARGRPQPIAPLTTPVQVDDTVLASIPRSYVVTAQDRAMMPALQHRMIREHPCQKVIELDADHAPFFSATDRLVAALAELAEVPTGARPKDAQTPA